MMSFKELAELEGRLVILRFNDGHQVKAKLVSVDLDEPQEIIYVVSEVLVAGPPQLAGVVAGTAAAAGPSELESVSVDSQSIAARRCFGPLATRYAAAVPVGAAVGINGC